MVISCDLLNHWARDHSEPRSIASFIVPELDYKAFENLTLHVYAYNEVSQNNPDNGKATEGR
jgi:hypothetical protein